MKKRLTKGEKWLFASPLLLLLIGGLMWRLKKTVPDKLPIRLGEVINSMAFSPDSRRIMVSQVSSYPNYQNQMLYDVETRKVISVGFNMLYYPPTIAYAGKPIVRSYGMHLALNSQPAWSSDGKWIVSSYADQTARKEPDSVLLWDTGITNATQSAAMLHLPRSEKTGAGAQLHFSPDDSTLIGSGVPLAIYNPTTGKRLNKPDTRFAQSNTRSKLNETLGLLALVDEGGYNFRVVDYAPNPSESNPSRANPSQANPPEKTPLVWKPELNDSVTFEWYGDILCVTDNVASGRDSDSDAGPNRLLLWDGKTRQPLRKVFADSMIRASAINLATEKLAYVIAESTATLADTSRYDSALVVWDYRANHEVWRVQIPELLIGLQWSPDGKWLAVLANEQTKRGDEFSLYVYEQSGRQRLNRSSIRPPYLWSPDSKKLALNIVDNSSRFHYSSGVEIYHFDD